MGSFRWLGIVLLTTACSLSVASGPQASKGLEVFAQCQSCHEIGKGAKHGVGPHLNGLLKRKIGGSPDYAYSDAFIAASQQDKRWTKESLALFLAKPDQLIPGTKMLATIVNADERNAVIAMLGTIDSSGNGAPTANKDPEPPAALLSIKGDPEYGEYLAGECITCHQADGSNQGIPSITGWPVSAFLKALHAYRSGSRENPVMQNIAKALGDEELAALAAYFARQ